VYGTALHPILLKLTEKLCLVEGQRDLAMQACQAIGELNLTEAIPLLAKVADTSQDRALVDSIIFILARLGDTARADKIIEGLRRMIETNPGNAPTLWVQIANGYARMNAYAKAEAGYRKAIAQAKELGQPAPGVAWYNLACQIAKLGKKDEAMAAIHERMKLPQPDVDWMATDGDLGLLRDHPEFLKYLYADGTEQQLVKRAAQVGTTHPASALIIPEEATERLQQSATLLVYLAAGYADTGKLDQGAEALVKANDLARGGLNWQAIGRFPGLQALKKLPNWEELSAGKKKEDEKKEDF
jgi:tetratricopeptide (TPR) repeat protein